MLGLKGIVKHTLDQTAIKRLLRENEAENWQAKLKEVIKRPSRRECNTRVRTPTPILMKILSGLGFGLKPTPDNFFLDFDPKNGVILGSEG